MLINIKTPKNLYTNILLFIFFIILVTGTTLSELFKAPKIRQKNLEKYINLFTQKELASTVSIDLKNRFGKFSFQKDKNSWKLISPRSLPAKNSILENALSTLSKIEIKHVFQKDMINFSNYSLDKPLTEIKLMLSNKKEFVIKFGLINPINNSTYIYISKKDAIYHTKNVQLGIEGLNLNDFIDSRVFTKIPQNLITEIKIYKGTSKQSHPSLFIKKENNEWKNKYNTKLSQKKVNEYLNQFFSFSSFYILDELNENLNKKINYYLKRSIFTVIIKDSNEKTYSYEVSNPINKLPGVSLEKWQNFIVKPKNDDFPRIVNRKFLNLFTKKTRHLK